MKHKLVFLLCALGFLTTLSAAPEVYLIQQTNRPFASILGPSSGFPQLPAEMERYTLMVFVAGQADKYEITVDYMVDGQAKTQTVTVDRWPTSWTVVSVDVGSKRVDVPRARVVEFTRGATLDISAPQMGVTYK